MLTACNRNRASGRAERRIGQFTSGVREGKRAGQAANVEIQRDIRDVSRFSVRRLDFPSDFEFRFSDFP
jgi:hypothetical protein